MATPPSQQAVFEYHQELLQQHGHDMHEFHADWHMVNLDPRYPQRPSRTWGTDIAFGTNFLQMHHEMIKAADNENKQHMSHPSIASWYQSKGYELPPEWNPLEPIPPVLAFSPPSPSLRRITDNPQFQLPKYFTRQGVPEGETDSEPITGARKLGDFTNINQLGCCIVYPHNEWHGAIGGAMNSLSTAIDDPIFYFGVHWHIDRVFDEFKLILAERDVRPFDRFALRSSGAQPSEDIVVPEQFTPDQIERLERAFQIGETLRQVPQWNK